MKTKTITAPVEVLGLNLDKVTQENLEELSQYIEKCIVKELEEILGPRILGYIATISSEIYNNTLTISIDIEADLYLPSYMNLESMLDKVIHSAFERARVYISNRFRDHKEDNPK